MLNKGIPFGTQPQTEPRGSRRKLLFMSQIKFSKEKGVRTGQPPSPDNPYEIYCGANTGWRAAKAIMPTHT